MDFTVQPRIQEFYIWGKRKNKLHPSLPVHTPSLYTYHMKSQIFHVFTFNAGKCIEGCRDCVKACQVKNQLPEGVTWRRVVEVHEAGSFLYNLSITCNHCTHPKCAGVCPTDAYFVRNDGIVSIDPLKCMGCGYCAWACPYNAPRYNPTQGQMTKCNFCADNLDAGLPPACVVACPQQALGYEKIDGERAVPNENHWLDLWKTPASAHPFPLPTHSRTRPHLAITPTPAMTSPTETRSYNQEELKPTNIKSELPLVSFTLLIQMAVGGFWSLLSWSLLTPNSIDGKLTFTSTLISILLATLGLASAFLHLGKPQNAWRSVQHWKKSWLSREILFTASFVIFGLVTAHQSGIAYREIPMLYSWYGITHWSLVHPCFTGELSCNFILPSAATVQVWMLVTSILGAASVYSMARVYRLHIIAAWDTWRTTAGFFVTTALLGQATILVLAFIGNTQLNWGIITALLVIQLGLWLQTPHQERGHIVRALLIVSALCGAAALTMTGNHFWLGVPVIFSIFIEETLGRKVFYQALTDKAL